MSKPLLWFKLKFYGKMWKIWLATWEHVPEFPATIEERALEEKLSGVTDKNSNDVFIDACHPMAWQDETLHHELCHIAYTRMERSVSYDVEEHSIRAISPPMYGWMKEFGMQWPERPDGYVAMRRRASRLAKARAA